MAAFCPFLSQRQHVSVSLTLKVHRKERKSSSWRGVRQTEPQSLTLPLPPPFTLPGDDDVHIELSNVEAQIADVKVKLAQVDESGQSSRLRPPSCCRRELCCPPTVPIPSRYHLSQTTRSTKRCHDTTPFATSGTRSTAKLSLNQTRNRRATRLVRASVPSLTPPLPCRCRNSRCRRHPSRRRTRNPAQIILRRGRHAPTPYHTRQPHCIWPSLSVKQREWRKRADHALNQRG